MPNARALSSDWRFWLAMLAASALGTNIGDLWVDDLGLGRPLSFASMAAVCALGIWADRRVGGRSEAGYWIAIVALRAAATNLGDFLTHDLRIGYAGVSAASPSRRSPWACAHGRGRPGTGSPLIDSWYWAAMLMAGLFGTVAGDAFAHATSHAMSAAVLTLCLGVAVAVRDRAFPTAVVGYWCIVLIERCAGTPIGDLLASRRSLALGAAAATLCTGAAFAAALVLRRSARAPQPA